MAMVMANENRASVPFQVKKEMRESHSNANCTPKFSSEDFQESENIQVDRACTCEKLPGDFRESMLNAKLAAKLNWNDEKRVVKVSMGAE